MPKRNKRLHLCLLLSCSLMKFRSCSFATVRHKTLNQSGNRSDTGHSNPACVCTLSVCVRVACVCLCVSGCACMLSVRASRPTLASALHQRPSIIEQKLCDAQGNEIVYFYHSRIPHSQHTLPVCTAIHRHRRIAFFFQEPQRKVKKNGENECSASKNWMKLGGAGGGRGAQWGPGGGAFRGTTGESLVVTEKPFFHLRCCGGAGNRKWVVAPPDNWIIFSNL